MSNAGVEISDDPAGLDSIIADGEETMLVAWTNVLPLAAQTCLASFDVESLMRERNREEFKILPKSWKHYPALTPFFDVVANLRDRQEAITGHAAIRPLIEIFSREANNKTDTFRWHTDKRPGPRNERISGILIARVPHDAADGGFQFLDKEGESALRPPRSEKANIFHCGDESRIRTLPFNAFSMFVSPDLIHRGMPIGHGYRYRVFIEDPSHFPQFWR